MDPHHRRGRQCPPSSGGLRWPVWFLDGHWSAGGKPIAAQRDEHSCCKVRQGLRLRHRLPRFGAAVLLVSQGIPVRACCRSAAVPPYRRRVPPPPRKGIFGIRLSPLPLLIASDDDGRTAGMAPTRTVAGGRRSGRVGRQGQPRRGGVGVGGWGVAYVRLCMSTAGHVLRGYGGGGTRGGGDCLEGVGCYRRGARARVMRGGLGGWGHRHWGARVLKRARMVRAQPSACGRVAAPMMGAMYRTPHGVGAPVRPRRAARAAATQPGSTVWRRMAAFCWSAKTNKGKMNGGGGKSGEA